MGYPSNTDHRPKKTKIASRPPWSRYAMSKAGGQENLVLLPPIGHGPSPSMQPKTPFPFPFPFTTPTATRPPFSRADPLKMHKRYV